MPDAATGESEERAAIVDLLHRARIALWMQDFEAYAQCLVHTDYVTRWHASPSMGIFRREGWDDIAARLRKTFEDPNLRIERYAHDVQIENLKLRICGDMAWATYHQTYPSIGQDQYYYFGGVGYEVKVLEKCDGIWLIAFAGVMHGSVGRFDTPILQVKADGTVTWQGPAATAVLEEDDDLTIRNGRVRFRDAKADRRLKAALSWAATRDTGLLPQRGTYPIVIETGEGLPVKVYWVFAEGGQISLSLHVPGIDRDRLNVAAAIFGLSPSQKQIAGLVVEGLSLPDIAERLEITLNTVRTHMNRVFVKTGVRTQPALVRVLLSSAPPV